MSKAIILVALVAAVNCAFPSNNYYDRQRYQHPQRYQQQHQQQHQQQRNYYHQPGPDAQAQILRNDQQVNPDSFQYAYETSNGIRAQEAGQLKQIGRDAAIVTQGSYSYISPEGEPVEISYIADENGFQPTGSHIPTPPPIPEAIQRSIDYILRVNGQRAQQPQQRYYHRF